jgi:predicted membrane-bound spermidine synthase
MNQPAFPKPVIFGVFVLSGISALIYQLVWQRSLLMIFGSNVESVAMVVAAFLMGLGIGSIAGGWVSRQERVSLVLCFGITELLIGAYGLVSLKLFRLVDEHIAMPGGLLTGALAFALVFVPTLLMGSTLPLLVAQQVRAKATVGEAVSWLYFVNTLGAAIGAYLAASWVLPSFGLSGSVQLAACLNAVAALIILNTAAIQKLRA